MKPWDCADLPGLPVCRLFGLSAALFLNQPNLDIAQKLARVLPGETQPLMSDNLGSLRRDYTALFISPVSGRYLPPFESVQREGRLKGKAATQVERIYRQAGFDPVKLKISPYWKSLPCPDHIGFELAFFANLLAACEKGQPGCQDLLLEPVLKAFWENHLEPWVPSYAQRLETQAHTELYRFLGALTLELIGRGEKIESEVPDVM